MVSTWLVVRRVTQPSTRMLGEVALGALLLVALALNPHDGVPGNGNDSRITAPFRLQATQVDQPSLGLTLPGLNRLPAWASNSGAVVKARAELVGGPPVELLIPSLNVHRPVEAIGANRSKVLNLPVNAWNAGWYKDGPVPGAPGDAVIEGHAGYPDQPMLFAKLSSLKPGAQIVVVLADGTRRLFLVVRTTSVPVGVAPPDLANPDGAPRLTLITCTGSFDANTFSYSRRLVVEASYAGKV
jgi:LPXTG-site transpeptidase (sortase) family protein